MKRKTSTTPTRIYAYGCRPPTTNADIVEDQFRRSGRYRNALIEVERWRREQIALTQRERGDLGPMLVEIDALEAQMETSRAAIRDKKSGTARAARPEVTAEREAIKVLSIRLRTARDTLRARRTELKQDPELVARYEAIGREAHQRKLAARAASGLRAGTYTRVEQAVEQSGKTTRGIVRFVRYDGTGSIGTQLIARSTSGGAMGMTVRELFSCQDTRLQIDPLPDDTYQRRRHHRRKASRTTLRLRVGSNPDRSPIFAEFPIILHRPLPDDAVIKWAYVVRRRVGLRLEWTLQLTIESETFASPTAGTGSGVVAVDLGWRTVIDDEGEPCGVRVGYALDDQGAAQDLRVPERTRLGLEKPVELRSVRDTIFAAMRMRLVAWLQTIEAPEWLRKDTSSLHLWNAPRRLAALMNAWSTQRFANDEPIMVELAAWAKQDRHLYAWESHQRDRRINHRREHYRIIAAAIARRYATIVIEDRKSFRLTDPVFAHTKATEDGDPSDGRDQRRIARLAAPGELRDAIVKAAAKYGVKLVEVNPAYTTQRCAACGIVPVEPWNARASIMHTCSACGTTWDQDENACKNMLLHHASCDPMRVNDNQFESPQNQETSTDDAPLA